jgi:hypothetical protein
VKCTRTDEIPNFVVRGYSETFTPFLCHIFILGLLTGKFSSLWKQAVIPLSKKSSVIINYRPLLNTFQTFLEVLYTISVLLILNCKVYPNHHGFVTNLWKLI